MIKPSQETPPNLGDAIVALSELLMSGEAFRAAMASATGTGIREIEAISHLLAHGPMNLQQLGTRLRLTRGSMTALVDRLEAQQLAVRSPHPSDRRVIMLSLTDRAIAAGRVAGASMASAFAAVPRSTSRTNIALLSALAVSLREHAPATPPVG